MAPRPIALLSPLLALVGCTAHHHDGPSGPAVVHETEPNDDAHQADFIADLVPGTAVSVVGHVADIGYDLFDGFAFHALQPVYLEVDLILAHPWADLDLCVYDPYLDQNLFCFASPGGEQGELTVWNPGELHLVVSAYEGAAEYELRVRAYGIAPVSADAPARATAEGLAPLAERAQHALERHERYRRADEPAAQDAREARPPRPLPLPGGVDPLRGIVPLPWAAPRRD